MSKIFFLKIKIFAPKKNKKKFLDYLKLNNSILQIFLSTAENGFRYLSQKNVG